MQVAKKELKLECDYEYEARCQLRFVQLIEDDPDFRDVVHVPMPIPELCSSSVLCSEWVPGVHIDKVALLPCCKVASPPLPSFPSHISPLQPPFQITPTKGNRCGAASGCLGFA